MTGHRPDGIGARERTTNHIGLILAELVPLVLFSAITLAGLVALLRGGDPRGRVATSRFTQTFAVLAAAEAVAFVTERMDDPSASRAVLPLLLAMVAAFPFLLLRFAASFMRVAHWETFLAGGIAILLTLVGSLIHLPQRGDPATTASSWYSAIFALAWVVLSLRVMIGLLVAGRGRPCVVRQRLRALTLGIGLLSMSLVASAAGPDLPRAVGLTISTLSALVTLLAYTPPAWLRAAWRRPDLDRVRAATRELLLATDEAGVGTALFPAVPHMVGADAAALTSATGAQYASWGVPLDASLPALGQLEPMDDAAQHLDDLLCVWTGHAWLVLRLEQGAPLFGEEELHLARSIGWMIGSAMQRIDGTRRLREREAQLVAAQELAQIGSWEWDVHSDTVTWSPNLYRMFGVDPETPIDYASYQQRLHPDDRERISAIVQQAVAAGESYELDHRIVRDDGTVLEIHSRGMPVEDGSGEVVRLFGVVQDVTRQRAAEQHLRDALETEREVRQRLQAVDELKDNLLAAVSHELRTPLTTVLGFALTLRDRRHDLDEATIGQAIEHLANESLRLERMLVDLLDIDRLQRGALQPSLDNVDLDGLVRSVRAALPEEMRDRVEVVGDGDPVIARVDAAKLERVVENLLVNAGKHTRGDARIWVAASLEDGTARIVVEDDGEGIPVEAREGMFAPFVRGGSNLGHAPGLGIGLALVSQLTRLHGGTVAIEDREGGGARFVVELPQAHVRSPRTPA